MQSSEWRDKLRDSVLECGGPPFALPTNFEPPEHPNPNGDLCESHWSAGILPAWGVIFPEKRRLEASAPVVVRPFAEVSFGIGPKLPSTCG
jgi:hypothetical protein